MEASISTSATSVASQDEPTTRFTNFKELCQAIDDVGRNFGDFLIVTDVSPPALQQIDDQRFHAYPSRRFRLRRYHADINTLIVTVPNALHEHLHLGIYNAFRDQLVKKGRQRSWSCMGATTFTSQGHLGGNGRKGDFTSGEGDSTGDPDPERAFLGGWPTLVVAAGVSETLNELHKDMRWWFSTSKQHQVKTVLLVKFGEQDRPEILIEKWEEEPHATRLGATTTRQAAALQPVLRQSITITRNTTTNPVSYHVTKDALVLSFRLLFLRNPNPPQEGNITITIPELEEFAEDAWRLVPN
jgi:hypothetical protein